MAIAIYLGGTDGAADGTLEVPGDNVGITLEAEDSVATFHFRAPTGKQNAETVTVNAPLDCEVSVDGVNYGPTANYTVGTITDVNVPCYVKRTDITAPDNTREKMSTTPHVVAVAVENIPAANLAPNAFTPTVSAVTNVGCTVDFGTTDPNGDTLTYKVAVTTSATPPADWAGYATRTAPAEITGLTANTDHYAHVRASDGALATVGTSAKFTTQAAADTTAPTLTGTLTAIPSGSSVSLDWPDATDNVAVVGYEVEYGTTTSYGTAVSPNPTASTVVVSDLTAGLTYYFRVRAYDAAGNKSAWLTASTATVDTNLTGTLTAAVHGLNVVLSGITGNTTSPKTLARFEARRKLASDSTWSAASTLMTIWGSPTTLAAPKLLYTLPTVGTYDVQVRVVDSTGSASEWASATVVTAYTSLPVSDTFSEVTYGASIDGVSGYVIDKTTANLSQGTVVRGDSGSLTGLYAQNNAPASSPATSADIQFRKLIGVDVTAMTYFEAVLTPASRSGVQTGIQLAMTTPTGTFTGAVSLNYTGSTGVLTCYNGSSWVTIKSGLSGPIKIRIVPNYGTQTAGILVNDEFVVEATVWKVINAPIALMTFYSTGGGLANANNFGIDNVAIGRL